MSQFTLYADTAEGPTAVLDGRRAARGRPSRRGGVRPRAGGAGVRVGRGVFGAHMQVELVNDGPVTDPAGRAEGRAAAGPLLRWRPHVPGGLRGQPVRHELLAAGGRRRSEALVVDPGFSPERVTRPARRRGEAAGGGAGDARPLRPRRRGGGDLRHRAAPVHPQGRRARAHRPGALGGGLPVDRRAARAGPHGVRRRRDRRGRVRAERGPHARPHAGERVLPDRRAAVHRRPGLQGDDRAVRLPELVRGGDAREPPAIPDAAGRRSTCCPGHLERTTVAMERATNPFLLELA